MKVQFNEDIESKSLTTASTDNNAKKSTKKIVFNKIMKKLCTEAVIKSSEQQRSEQKVNRSQSFHAHFETKI